jgi:hypothetical protein
MAQNAETTQSTTPTTTQPTFKANKKTNHEKIDETCFFSLVFEGKNETVMAKSRGNISTNPPSRI